MNPYEELNVDPGANDSEIKAAYRKQANKHHPDKGGNDKQFHLVKTAFDILSDPDRRKHYDETGNTNKQTQPKDVAKERIVGVFNSIISSEHFMGNIIDESRKIFDRSLKELSAFRKKQNKELKRLNKLSGRVKAKKNNLYQQTLDSKIQGVKQAIHKADQEDLIFNEIFDLLNDYEDNPPEPEVPEFGTTIAWNLA